MKWTTIKAKVGNRCTRLARFSLTQFGYRCKNEKPRISENNHALLLLIIGFLSFILSLSTADATDVLEVLANIGGTSALFVVTHLSHQKAVKKRQSSSRPVDDNTRERTPHGSQLLTFALIAFYNVAALLYQFARHGEFYTWLINFAAYFIEICDIIIAILVMLFDAEFDIE